VAEDIRQQQNREAVAIEAVAEVREAIDSSPELTAPPIEAEWVDRFWRLAQDITDADIQAVWGKILALKTTGRGTYSARCLETISLLSHEEITHLERLATLLWTTTLRETQIYYVLYNVHALPAGALPTDLTSKLYAAVGNLHREIFGPAGIALDSGSGWAQDSYLEAKNGIANVMIANAKYNLVFPDAPEGRKNVGASLGISPLGAEIFSLIKADPDPTYIAALTDAFKFYNIEMRTA
jgi:hypothetical protein